MFSSRIVSSDIQISHSISIRVVRRLPRLTEFVFTREKDYSYETIINFHAIYV